ncbi:MAG: undecaprenyl-diphosphate phosphatase [Synergistes sp.]|nr:undecaprenyl-diphosphate phosphatase [Synergistes sp.]
MDLKVVLLGIIQGLTEFLPVSSSGHLALARIFLGMELPPLNYDLILHVATVLATLVFFAPDILELLAEWFSGFFSSGGRKRAGWRIGWAVIAGTVITAAIGLFLKKYAEEASMNSLAVAAGLIVTAAVLFLSRKMGNGCGHVTLTDGLYAGIAQGLAVFPGVSRSGLTIMAGLAAGLSKEEAFRFSFLLSVPAILGAAAMQALEIGGWHEFVSTLPPGWYIGALCAFVSGLLSLFVLKRLVIASKWWLFGVYCLTVGMLAAGATYLGAW